MQKIYQSVVVCIFILTATNRTTGQTFSIKFDLPDLYKKNQFDTFNRDITLFKEGENQGIRFPEGNGEGIAWIRGYEFSNGIIELDIRCMDINRRCIAGIAFHGTDNDTLDVIYFCPSDYLSADPERISDAVQYISLPGYERGQIIEKGEITDDMIPEKDLNEWFHMKIIIHYPEISVYINKSNIPCLEIKKQNTRLSGRIGFWAGNNSGADFANLVITTIRRNQRVKVRREG